MIQKQWYISGLLIIAAFKVDKQFLAHFSELTCLLLHFHIHILLLQGCGSLISLKHIDWNRHIEAKKISEIINVYTLIRHIGRKNLPKKPKRIYTTIR